MNLTQERNCPCLRYRLAVSLCDLQLMCCDPAFLEMYRTAVAQSDVQPPIVVERQPVNHLINRLPVGYKLLQVQPAHLHSTPQTFRWPKNL